MSAQTSPRHRVVVTGIGAVTPLGLSAQTFWDAMMRRESGAAPYEGFDTERLSTKFGCQVKGFDATDYMDRKQARRLDAFCKFGLAAAAQCFADAGVDTSALSDDERDRFGVILGSGIGGFELIERQVKIFHEKGPDNVSPFLIPMMITNMAAGLIAIEHGLRGPNHCVVSACATGNHNISDALMLLRHGHADAILAGGAEAITSVGVAGFAAMKALSKRNDTPATASRPFDETRDGFVAGEGAGAILLETLDRAKARGARIYAELAGMGMSADAHHFAAPDPEGRGVMLAMRNALRDAEVAPEDVDHINMHATSTPLGDVAESEAIKKVFGDHARSMALCSTKSMTGHMLGAASAVEAVATIMAMQNNTVPPTINCEQPDPACDLDYCTDGPRERTIDVAMSNAFGFGGHNTTIVFKRFVD